MRNVFKVIPNTKWKGCFCIIKDCSSGDFPRKLQIRTLCITTSKNEDNRQLLEYESLTYIQCM